VTHYQTLKHGYINDIYEVKRGHLVLCCEKGLLSLVDGVVTLIESGSGDTEFKTVCMDTETTLMIGRQKSLLRLNISSSPFNLQEIHKMDENIYMMQRVTDQTVVILTYEYLYILQGAAGASPPQRIMHSSQAFSFMASVHGEHLVILAAHNGEYKLKIAKIKLTE
jgi:hypothetical protein